VHELAGHASPGVGDALGPDLVVVRDEVVDVTADRLLCCVVEQPLRGRVPGSDDPAGVHQHDRDGVRLDERLVVPPLALDLADVVVDDAVPDPLAPDQDGCGEELDVDEGAVLVGPARDHANPPASGGFGVEPDGLLPLLGRPRNQIVDADSDRLFRAVAEEAFRPGIPRRDVHLVVDRDDRGRADVQDGFEPALLPLNLADVVIQDQDPDPLLAHDDGRRNHLDVHEGTVLSCPAADRLGPFPPHRGTAVRLGLLAKVGQGGDEVVELLADRLLGRVSEQRLGAGVPGLHRPVQVGHHDGRRADLEDRLEIALLLLELPHVVIEDVLRDELAPDRHGPAHDVDVDDRSVLSGSLGQHVDARGLQGTAVQILSLGV
jgi:hypothetical protein